MADKIGPTLEKISRPFYVQGRELSRMEMLRSFAKAGNGILLGTDTFWTGVDVPGPALSQVIVTRLPFENPTHPIAQARQEWLQAQGRNPFLELTLPEAVLKFRQGIGRLIRKKSDTGIITILDSRIIRKQYGAHFIDALPTTYQSFQTTARPDLSYLGL